MLNMFCTYNRSDVGCAIQVTIPRENCDRSDWSICNISVEISGRVDEVIWALKRDGVNLIDERNGL